MQIILSYHLKPDDVARWLALYHKRMGYWPKLDAKTIATLFINELQRTGIDNTVKDNDFSDCEWTIAQGAIRKLQINGTLKKEIKKQAHSTVVRP